MSVVKNWRTFWLVVGIAAAFAGLGFLIQWLVN